ncbi:MAG: histidine phosphatase family protein [Patescibacteria group bacterium]
MRKKKTIYLVRHGEAEHNLKEPPRLYRGPLAELTELGHQQAQCIAERASKLPIDALIASTMVRAQQTAGHISRRIDKSIIACEFFVEVLLPSQLEGKVWLDPEVQRIHDEWGATMYTHQRVLDGENFPDIQHRSHQALRYLEDRPEENIMVVTHGLFKRALVATVVLGDYISAAALQKMEFSFRTVNTGLTILSFDPDDKYSKWSMLSWNDYGHL